MSALTDKVDKLVALASSSNVEEARAAAYQACRLIREHKLAVVDPKEARRRAPAFDDLLDKMRRRPPRETEPWATGTRVRTAAAPRAGRGVGSDVTFSPSSVAGLCVVCCSMYYPRDLIGFYEGVGVVHAGKCGAEAMRQQGARQQKRG